MSTKTSFAAIVMGSLPTCVPAFAQGVEDAGRSEVSAQFIGTFVHTANKGVFSREALPRNLAGPKKEIANAVISPECTSQMLKTQA